MPAVLGLLLFVALVGCGSKNDECASKRTAAADVVDVALPEAEAARGVAKWKVEGSEESIRQRG